MRRRTVWLSLLPMWAGILASGCASSRQTDPQAIRQSFGMLQSALRSHDTQTICRLLAPVGQSASLSALQKRLPALTRVSDQRLRAETQDCAQSLRSSDIAPLQRGLGGLSLRLVTLVDDHDLAKASTASTRPLDLIFIKVAGQWRLAFGAR